MQSDIALKFKKKYRIRHQCSLLVSNESFKYHYHLRTFIFIHTTDC